MLFRKLHTGYEVWAPAKINLRLDVFERRADGFHELETLITTVSLYDTLRFTVQASPEIAFSLQHVVGRNDLTPSDYSVPEDNHNLVVQALDRLREVAGVSRGAKVHLVKRIPTQAGLGGGSSDAAAALLAANRGWELGWNRQQLCHVAAELGSDISSFLHQSPVIGRGRGEQISPAAPCEPLDIVVVKPPEGLATADVYAAYKPQPRRANRLSGPRPQPGLWDRQSLAGALSNDLQPAAEKITKWISRLSGIFDELDVLAHQMSGSGTAYFGICRHAKHAIRLAGRLKNMRMGRVFRTTTTTGCLRA